MSIYYVGIGGNNANNGLTWATRKLTLNGAEDVPVVAGDTVYVGPGAYREQLTCDVSGAAGTPITYIGDVTGEHTDGVGGIVRITGSDNDQTVTRNYCVDGNTRSYRTFRGFSMDTVLLGIYGGADSRTNWIVEDCYAQAALVGIYGANQANWTIRRCVAMLPAGTTGVITSHAAAVDNAGHLIENCLMISYGLGISSVRVGGITVKNCNFIGQNYSIRVATALTVGQTITVNNCIFYGCLYGTNATVLGEVVENYNSFYGVGTPRTNVAVGANSNAYSPIFNPLLLQDGFVFPQRFGELSKWSQIARITDGGTYAADDLFGLAKPVTDTKRSWGAIQYTGATRETSVTQGSSIASLKLPDAGELFLMRVPISGISTTFTAYVYRETDYTGDNPQLIVRQAGQSDNVDTATGATGTWEQLSVTCIPTEKPEWADLFLVSRNTATSGSYAIYVDTISVN